MQRVAETVTIAVPWLWAGMVLAISFLETPLKFRARGITLALGLGIGRLVFRALGRVEAVLAVVLVGAAAAARPGAASWVLVAVAAAVVAAQIGVLRPQLDRRTTAVIDGAHVPPSRRHLVYVVLEVLKVAVLVGLGVLGASGVAR